MGELVLPDDNTHNLTSLPQHTTTDLDAAPFKTQTIQLQNQYPYIRTRQPHKPPAHSPTMEKITTKIASLPPGTSYFSLEFFPPNLRRRHNIPLYPPHRGIDLRITLERRRSQRGDQH